MRTALVPPLWRSRLLLTLLLITTSAGVATAQNYAIVNNTP